MNLAAKIMVVTGASGFIGSHLVEHLAKAGYSVRALTRSKSASQFGNLNLLRPELRERAEIKLADVLDGGDLRTAFEGADCVFHLAAQISVPYSFRAPSLFLQTNVLGTLNVLQAAVDARVGRVVLVSSSEVYGGTAKGEIPESQELLARSPYAASKIAAEKLGQSYWHGFGLPVVIVRPFNTFGPRQSVRAVVPWIIKQALSSSSIALGNVNAIRDLVYVSDTVEGMIAASTAKNVEGRTFNLATGRGVRVDELVQIVGRLLGKELKIHQDLALSRDTTREVWTLIGSQAAAQEALGWQARASLEHGLGQVISAMRLTAESASANEWDSVISKS